MARMKSWTVKHLSYAGRFTLVKAVLTSMQNFWCQLFILPKKIMKEIQKLLKKHLWLGRQFAFQNLQEVLM